MMLTRLFPGEETLSPEEVEELLENEQGRATGTHEGNQYSQAEASAAASTIEANPLADDVLNPDETHRVEKMSQRAKRPKGNIFNKDVTGIAFILFGIPVLLVVVFVAMMVTIMDGGGFGTFLAMLLLFGVAFILNVIKG